MRKGKMERGDGTEGCDLTSPKLSQSKRGIALLLMSSSSPSSHIPYHLKSIQPAELSYHIHDSTPSFNPPSSDFPNCFLSEFKMATNSLHSIQHHCHSLLKRHHPSDTPPTILSSPLFLKAITVNSNPSLSSSSSSSFTSLAFSVSPITSSSPPTSQTISFDLLRDHLSAKDFRQADEETRRLLIVLAGEAAQKRGYVFFSEVQFISETDLKTIDDLWRQYSDNKFGYSVQKKIFEKVDRDFTKFFLKVGWMKKLDTEMEQYNYRSFPTEFIWELNDGTPEGHLPLTNALRGTQLLSSLLNNPAFDAVEEEAAEDKGTDNGALSGLKDIGPSSSSSKPLTERIFKPDYSF